MELIKKIGFIFILLLSLVSVNAVVNDAITYYSFDESDVSGSTVVDLSGNNNNGTCVMDSGCDLITGKLINATDFDGVNDYINTDTDLGTVYTITGWAYFETFDSTRSIVGIRDSTGSAGTREFQLAHSSSNTILIQYYTASNGNAGTFTGSITENAWNYITLTRNGNNIELFVDTISIGTDSTASKHNPSEFPVLGRLGDQAIQFWQGDLDEFAIYNKVLNSTNIDELYNGGVGFNPYIISVNPVLTFTDIKADNITLVNNTFFNSSINFETIILNTSTNGNVNHTYSLNGNTSIQYATNTLTGSVNLNLSEGDYNISFYAFNNETNVSSSNYSFIVDRTAPTIDIIGNITQDVYKVNFSTIFNVTDILSGLSSCTLNITYLSDNQSDSNFFINCTDTQVFTRAGIYNGNLIAIDNAGNSNQLIVNGTINPVSNIFFEDEFNVSISNYDYTLVSPIGRIETEVNTNNPVQISPIFNQTTDFGIYNITFSKVGYITQTVQVEINSTNAGQNVTFNINDAEIIVTILDRETETIISGPFFQLEFIAAVGLVTNTTTGTKTITNTFFEAGQYQLVSSGDNYTTEQLFFEFTNQESLSLTIYTTEINDLARGIVEIKVVDKFGKSIVGAIGQALQWDSDTSSYIKVSEGLTAEDGKTLLNIILDTKQYIFQASFGDLSKNTTPQFIPELLNGKLITISLDLGPTEFEGFLENVNYNIIENFTNSVSNITFDWETTDGTDIEGCIIYYRVQPSGTKTELSNDCSTGSNNILMVSKQLNSSYYIEAQVGFIIDGGFYSQEEFLYQPLFDISTILEETNLALFILPLLYLVVVLIGMANVFIGAVLLLIVNGIGLWLLPQFITTPVVAFFYFIGIALMMGGSKRK